MRRIIDICWRLCKQVPLLPITILSAIPLALLGEWKPWGEAAWDSWISQVGVDGLSAFNPGVGQWIVIALVAYTIVVTVRGMIDDLRHGHVGVDLLAVVAIASTVAVQEYWAAWAVVLMISSGEAIEEFAQSKAESNLTALDRRGTANRARGRAARYAGACARVGQRAYGRRDRRRISCCQSVRFWRNGQPRR